MVRFIDQENKDWDEWGTLEVWKSNRWWHAKAVVSANDPDTAVAGYLIYSAEGDTVEEAIARVEKGLIETLAQGGQLEERRHGNGRRGYDNYASGVVDRRGG
jgi:hypothetical protein